MVHIAEDTRDQTVSIERVTNLSNERTRATGDEGRLGTTSDPQAAARMTPTPAGDTAPTNQPLLPAVQNGGWSAGGSSYPPPSSSLLFSPHVPAAQTPLSPAMTPTNGLMYPGFPFHSHANANAAMPPPVPGSFPAHIPPEAYQSMHRYASMFGYPFYPGIAAPGYPGMAAQQQHHGFTPFQSGTAYPGTPMLPPGMLPPVMPVQGSLDPPQQLRPQAPSQQPGA